MEIEGSLPCSQQSSTASYPDPEKSSPYHPVALILFLILFIHLHHGLLSIILLLPLQLVYYMN
jgi:hypothetical protein